MSGIQVGLVLLNFNTNGEIINLNILQNYFHYLLEFFLL